MIFLLPMVQECKGGGFKMWEGVSEVIQALCTVKEVCTFQDQVGIFQIFLNVLTCEGDFEVCVASQR